ncbi:transporter substrate-binding domain-containing protein [Pseudomonas sp. CAU 1711]|uniref:substrate-binding periplasmic protein n=1 Tax=Pseudomonas sp. CAU 1711 TaxID=3140356 RepID=UPI0032610FFC
MARRFLQFLILFLLGAMFLRPATAENGWQALQIYTEEFPPYNYSESGIARGIAVDVLLEAAEAAGLPLERKDIRSLPWARGYQLAQKGPGVLLFSMTRSQAREPLFQWVGPIIGTRVALIARKARGLKVNAPADLAAYKIGAIRDDIGHLLVRDLGIADQDLRLSANAVSIANMLSKDRIDLWAYDETTALWFIKRLSLNSADYETVHVLKDGEMYYAFSRDVDAEHLRQLQVGLDRLKGQRRYLDIINQYK